MALVGPSSSGAEKGCPGPSGISRLEKGDCRYQVRGLKSPHLLFRCTRLSTSPSWPWPTPRAPCSIFADAPFGRCSAGSASASCPSCPCPRPCRISSSWSQRGFCTDTQSIWTKTLVLFWGGGAVGRGGASPDPHAQTPPGRGVGNPSPPASQGCV